MWITVIASSLGCYVLKLAGMSMPPRLMRARWYQVVGAALPIGLLAALTAVQTFSTGQALELDPRAAGLGVALVTVLLRAPFLVTVAAAVATAAILRAIT